MSERTNRRQALAEHLADHLLAHGLPASNLRALGAAAGTSDRMLLYYFADKDALIETALVTVAARLADALAAAVPGTARVGSATLLALLLPALRSETLAPYMALWLEMAARAARGDATIQRVAAAIGDGFLVWLEARLNAPAGAPALLTQIEGMAVLDAIGRPEIANTAAAQLTG